MVKKIVLGTLLLGLIAFLVAGGIIRTVDKTGNVAEARGPGSGEGYGQGAGQVGDCDNEGQGNGGAGREVQSRGGGNGSGGGNATGQAAYLESTANEYVVYEGVVVESPTDGGELVIEMDGGEQVLVGTGPGYMAAQGFTLQVGEWVQVQGYLEGDELKAAQVTRLRDGETITLRDQTGRPAWAGGRGAQGEADPAQGVGGNQGQGQGRNGGWGQGSDRSGVSSAETDLSGSEIEALLLALDDEYRAWAVYDQAIADLGNVRPFPNIQHAEENHIAALVQLFERYGLDVPANPWPGNVPTFETLADACAAGVQAEIDNAALYERLFSMVDNPDIVQVFTSFQQASQTKHLPAFERCAP